MEKFNLEAFKDKTSEITISNIDKLKTLSPEELEFMFLKAINKMPDKELCRLYQYLRDVLCPDFNHNVLETIYSYCRTQIKKEEFFIKSTYDDPSTACREYDLYEKMFFTEMILYNKIKTLRRKHGCRPLNKSFKWDLSCGNQVVSMCFLPESSLDNIIKFIKDLYEFDLAHKP